MTVIRLKKKLDGSSLVQLSQSAKLLPCKTFDVAWRKRTVFNLELVDITRRSSTVSSLAPECLKYICHRSKQTEKTRPLLKDQRKGKRVSVTSQVSNIIISHKSDFCTKNLFEWRKLMMSPSSSITYGFIWLFRKWRSKWRYHFCEFVWTLIRLRHLLPTLAITTIIFTQAMLKSLSLSKILSTYSRPVSCTCFSSNQLNKQNEVGPHLTTCSEH